MLRLPEIDDLIFKGGSVKGIAYLGAKAALDACGFDFTQVKRVGGTSAGAITALGFALNLSFDELKTLLAELNFEDFLDTKDGYVSNSTFFKAVEGSSAKRVKVGFKGAKQISSELGLFDGSIIRDWLDKLIEKYTGIANCTFAELAAHPAEFKELAVVAFNLNTQLKGVFSLATTPDVIVSDAIRDSLSIPFLFAPWAIFRKIEGQRVKDASNDLWVDGGLVDNYPLHLFDKDGIHNPRTLGFYLMPEQQYEHVAGTGNVPYREITGAIDYSLAIIKGSQQREHNEHLLNIAAQEETIHIDSGNVSALAFNLTPEQKTQLFESGWQAVCKKFGAVLEIPKELCDFSPREDVAAEVASAAEAEESMSKKKIEKPACLVM